MAALTAFSAVNENVLYSFQGPPNDGFNPLGRLVTDQFGNLYGTTWQGENCLETCGTVFQVTPPSKPGGAWTERLLYQFTGAADADGSGPNGGMIWGYKGNLYGTTMYGGNGPCTILGSPAGCGVVYAMTPPAQKDGTWTESVIYSFQGGAADGYVPNGELVSDAQGNLYGVTFFGGGYGVCDVFYPYCGTVFELSPPTEEGGEWTEKVLYSFHDLADGAMPNGALVLDSSGAIYGTTPIGGYLGCTNGEGLVGCGVVYKLTPNNSGGQWTQTILYTFPAKGSGGQGPFAGMIFDRAGNLYGTTDGGGLGLEPAGTVFELSPPQGGGQTWSHTRLASFTYKMGGFPMSGLVFDNEGNLYGTTSADGHYGGGSAFKLNPPSLPGGKWLLDTIYNFKGAPDAGPSSGTLILVKGRLLGVALGGTGASCSNNGCGTVFAITP